MTDIRKKLFFVSELLRPSGATHISDGEQHFLCPHCPSPVHLHPSWHMGFAPVSHRGGVCQALPFLFAEQSRGHNKDHGSCVQLCTQGKGNGLAEEAETELYKISLRAIIFSGISV